MSLLQHSCCCFSFLNNMHFSGWLLSAVEEGRGYLWIPFFPCAEKRQMRGSRRGASFSSNRGFFLRSGGRVAWCAELRHAAGHPDGSCLLTSVIPPGTKMRNVTGVTCTELWDRHLPLSLQGSPSTEAGSPEWGFVVIWNIGKPRALGRAK